MDFSWAEETCGKQQVKPVTQLSVRNNHLLFKFCANRRNQKPLSLNRRCHESIRLLLHQAYVFNVSWCSLYYIPFCNRRGCYLQLLLFLFFISIHYPFSLFFPSSFYNLFLFCFLLSSSFLILFVLVFCFQVLLPNLFTLPCVYIFLHLC